MIESIPNHPIESSRAEKIAFWGYVWAFSLTAYGPIFHYSGWIVAVFTLLYIKIKDGTPLFPRFRTLSAKVISCTLILFALSQSIAFFFTAPSLYIWGKWTSIPIELLVGYWLTLRILDSENKLYVFAKFFSIANLVMVMIAIFGILTGYKLRDIEIFYDCRGLSIYLVFHYLFISFYIYRNKKIFILVSVIYSVILLLSFSITMWVSVVANIVVLVVFVLCYRKTMIKKMLVISLVFMLSLACCFCLSNALTNGRTKTHVLLKIQQATSIQDARVLTSSRNEIWKIAAMIVRDHPLTGSGYETLPNLYTEYYNRYKEKLNLTNTVTHTPHNLFIAVVQESGVISLVLFIFAYTVTLYRAFMLVKRDGDESFPWGLMCLMYFAGFLVYAIGEGNLFYYRRDIAVFCWFFWGLVVALPFRKENG